MDEQMRLFIGLSIPQDVLDAMDRAVAPLQSRFAVNWSPVANFHVTTKFIGSWPDERLAELTAMLRDIPMPAPIEVSIGGLGFYPDARKPKVFYAGVVSNCALTDLAHATDRALARIGCPAETRPYSPHLTLARLKTENIGGLREHIQSMQNLSFGSFTAFQFHLYLSEQSMSKASVSTSGAQRSSYSIIETFPVAAFPVSMFPVSGE
jgi:2'-5' RNA ligase